MKSVLTLLTLIVSSEIGEFTLSVSLVAFEFLETILYNTGPIVRRFVAGECVKVSSVCMKWLRDAFKKKKRENE